MTKRILVAIPVACMLAMLAPQPAPALEEAGPGVYRIESKTIDDLLTLREQPAVNLLVLESNDTNTISDAHMRRLRQWVESGGVLWVAGDGLKSFLAQTVAPFRIEPFDFVRSSTGNRGGELLVRGLSPRITIAEHPLTAGVSQLYLFPVARFDGTERAEPLVEMGDTSGNSGWVLVALPVGRGYMILDGTARKDRFFRRLDGFDDAHPNSLKKESGWTSYDWDTLQLNARDHAREGLAGGENVHPIGG